MDPLEITRLSPLSWKLLDRVCFVFQAPFPLQPLSVVCYLKSEWLYYALGYHLAIRGPYSFLFILVSRSHELEKQGSFYGFMYLRN